MRVDPGVRIVGRRVLRMNACDLLTENFDSVRLQGALGLDATLRAERNIALAMIDAPYFKSLNDERGLSHARRMLDAREVKLMLSAHLEESGAARIALNLLRTDIPMPRPFFEVQAPMLPWTLNSPNARSERCWSHGKSISE